MTATIIKEEVVAGIKIGVAVEVTKIGEAAEDTKTEVVVDPTEEEETKEGIEHNN
jgi:hypothetical protein